MKNFIYEVDWNYEDNDGWNDLHQYIVVYDEDSELGKEIEHHVADEDDVKNLDVALKKAFGITDAEVVFYLGNCGATEEPTIGDVAKELKESAGIIVKKVYDKEYEWTNRGE